MASLIVPALSLAVALAGDAPPPPALSAADLRAVTDRLDQFERSMQRLIDEQLQAVTKLSVEPLRDRLELLRKQVEQLQFEMAQLKRELQDPQGRKPRGDAIPTNGFLVLVNDFPFESMVVLINETQQVVVPPMARQTVPVTPGPFRFRVLQTDLQPRERQLVPGQSLTVTLKPSGS